MDIATIIGIAGGFLMLLIAVMLEGSSPLSFMNLLAFVVVVGGGTMAVLARYPVAGFVQGTVGGIRFAMASADAVFPSAPSHRRVRPVAGDRPCTATGGAGRGAQRSRRAHRRTST